MVQCSILLNGWLNEGVELNSSQDEKINNLGDGKAGKADKADKAEGRKRGVPHMTLYNRSGTQLSIPEKPNPSICLFPKNQTPPNIFMGYPVFIKKLTGLKKDTPILTLIHGKAHCWN